MESEAAVMAVEVQEQGAMEVAAMAWHPAQAFTQALVTAHFKHDCRWPGWLKAVVARLPRNYRAIASRCRIDTVL